MYLDSCGIFSEFGAFDKAKMQRKSAYGAGAATDEHSSKARVEASQALHMRVLWWKLEFREPNKIG